MRDGPAWQLVLDCMDHAVAPFSKGTLVAFRARLIAAELDRRLLERTVALYAQQAGRPAAGKLRAALDASPLWGRAGWRTRSTWWDTPCGWRWACWLAGRGGAGRR